MTNKPEENIRFVTENSMELECLVEDIVSELYRGILEAIDGGKIPSILFHMLGEEEFRDCFGVSKEELQPYLVE